MKEKFLWGCATAAPQIEGAYLEDGRTHSIWDVCKPGQIENNDNTHIACDFYHKYKEDIKLLKEIGINSFRLSFSWSRIIPEEGKINQKGIDFYNNLINELLKNNIEPLITIYHWDLPVWVFEKGGWESDKIIGLFEEYARICAVNFSDRVKYWFIFNEPQCFLTGAYFKGVGAPFYSHRDKMREITLTK